MTYIKVKHCTVRTQIWKNHYHQQANMKNLYMVLLAFLVLAVSQLSEARLIHLKPGTEYYYDYYGHYLTKLDSVGNRHVGFGLKAKVIIQVKTKELTIFKLERIQTAMLNEDIDQVDEDDLPWKFREDRRPLAGHLEKPVRVHWNDGRVTSLEVSATVPEEALNILKAIIAKYQLNIPRISSPLPQSESSYSSSYSNKNALFVKSDSVNDDVHVFKAMEDGVGGQCRTRYVVQSNPSPYRPNSEVLNITKYPNYHECEDPPMWIRSTHIPNQCADCDADDQHPLTVVATIEYGVKKRGDELTIETIEVESQTRFAPYTTDADHLVSNASQIFELIKKDSVFTNIPPIVSPRSIPSLKYTFPTSEHVRPQGLHDLLKKRMVPFLHDYKTNVVEQTKVLLEEITKEIKEQIKIEDTPLRILKLVKLIRLMNKDEVSQFYNEGCNSQRRTSASVPGNLQHQICIDALGMSGSYPAIIQLKYLIESKTIVGERAVQIVQAMPTNIFEPSEEIVSQILSISKSPVAKEYPQLHITSVLSTGILIGKACDGPEDDVPSLPTAPHIDTLCSPEIERKYIHELAEGLHNSRSKGYKMAYIRALGLTELPTAIGPLRPYAEGIAVEDEVVQVAALRALIAIAKFTPDEVMDIAEGEFYDTDNPKAVRIAALRAIIAAQPDLSDLQQIAAWSDKEPSDDIQGYIYGLFDTLSNTTHYCMKDIASNAEQLMAYLDEDDDNGIMGSNIWESSQIMDDLGISTRGVVSVTSSNSSILPEAIAAKINMTVAGYSVQPLKIGIQMKGTQSIINRIMGPSGAFNKIRSVEDLFKPESEVPDKQRSQINSKLNLDTRTDDPFFFSAFMKLGGTQARMVTLDHKDVIRYIKSGMQHGYTLEAIRDGIPINYNKVALPLEVRLQIPSILGVPTYVMVASVVIVRVQGKISVNLDARVPLQGLEVVADIKPSITTRLEIRQGVYNPFENVVSTVSVGTSTYIAPPISAKLDVNIIKGKVNFELKPSTEAYQSVTSSPKIFHYKVKPYSMHRSLAAVPVRDSVVDYKLIHSDLEPEVDEIDLSQYVLGLPLVFKSTSEHDWNDQTSFISDLQEYDGLIPFLTTYQVTSEFDARKYEVYLHSQGTKGKAIQVMAEWEYVPTPSENLVLQSMKSRRGFLPVLSGFAQLPQRCGSKSASEYNTNDDSWYYFRQALKVSMNIAEDDVDDDEDDDDDDDDDDEDDDDNDTYYNHDSQYYAQGNPYYYSSQRFNKTLSQYLKSPWQYVGQKYSSGSPYRGQQEDDDDDDDDDDDEISARPAYQGTLPYTSETRKDDSATISTISRSHDKSEYHLKLKLYGYGHSTAKLTSDFVLKRDLYSQTDVMALTVEVDNTTSISAKSLKICTTASIQYPDVPCDYHSLMSPRAAKPINANVAISWGPQCPSSNTITIKAKLEKSREQQQMESEKDEWYFKQCQTDIANGKKLTDACEIAQQEFSSLNKITVDVQYTKLSPWQKNLTAHVDTFIKSMFYPQMSNNPVDVDNGEGHLKAVGVLIDEVPSVNLYLYKPKENTFFRKVYLEDMFPYIYSVSTQQSLVEQFAEDITDGDAYPSCEVMGKYVNSFDNSTFKHHLTGCQHVIVKDCSPDDLFAVTMADVGNNMKKMNVHILSHKITVRPQGRYSGKFQVEIDGQSVQPTDEQVIVLKSNSEDAEGTVVALVVTTGPTLTIKMPTIGVAIDFDGEDASIEVSPLWASKVCGICGEYNDESDDDFRGPQQCLYGDAYSFDMSYGLPSPQCQLPSLRNTQKLCDSSSPIDYSSRRSTFYDEDYSKSRAANKGYSKQWRTELSDDDYRQSGGRRDYN